MGVKGFNNAIQDSRKVKRPVSARLVFLQDRYASGDMSGMGLGDAARLINAEWKALGAGEKQVSFFSFRFWIFGDYAWGLLLAGKVVYGVNEVNGFFVSDKG